MVLGAMGERGGWHVDALCEATGLPAAAVSCALLEIELGGQARRTAYGHETAGRAATCRASGAPNTPGPAVTGRRPTTHLGSSAGPTHFVWPRFC